jgi:hypothetical protein
VPYLPAYKDQIRSVAGPLAVQRIAEDPQPNAHLSAYSGRESTSEGASASSGKKSSRQSHHDSNSNYEIPMATTVVPVISQAVVEVKPETSSRPQLRP